MSCEQKCDLNLHRYTQVLYTKYSYGSYTSNFLYPPLENRETKIIKQIKTVDVKKV